MSCLHFFTLLEFALEFAFFVYFFALEVFAYFFALEFAFHELL